MMIVRSSLAGQTLSRGGESLAYSRTAEERTLWEQAFCPLFGGCPYLGGSLVFHSLLPNFHFGYSIPKRDTNYIGTHLPR